MALPQLKLEPKIDKTILVIDDDAQVRHLIQSFLEHEGFHVIMASNGTEGIRALQTQSPDLVLLDVRMPEMDGLKTLETLRKIGIDSTCPVIMVTSLGDEKTVSAAASLGASDYVVKPFDLKLLKYKINDLLFGLSFSCVIEILKALQPEHISPLASDEFKTLVADNWKLFEIPFSGIRTAILLEKNLKLSELSRINKRAAKSGVRIYVQNSSDGWERVWPIADTHPMQQLLKIRLTVEQIENAVAGKKP